MDLKKTGALIAALRKEHGLTQEQLAQRLGVTDKAVSRWETGRGFPEVSLLPALGEALDVSIAELVRGELDPGGESAQVENSPPKTQPGSVRTWKKIAGVLLLAVAVCGVVSPMYVTFQQGAIPLWGIAVAFVGITLLSKKLEKGLHTLGNSKGDWVALGALCVVLVLEASPVSVGMRFSDGPGKSVFHTFSSFDWTPFGYGNVFPMVTACLTIGTILAIVGSLRSQKRNAQLKSAGTLLGVLAFAASLAPVLLFGWGTITAFGAAISVLLLMATVFLYWKKVETVEKGG